MNLDIRTIIVCILVVAYTNAATLLLGCRQGGSFRSVFGYWSLGQALLATGMVLIFYSSLPSNKMVIVISNLLMIAASVAVQEGIGRFVGRRGYGRNVCLAVLVFQITAFTYLTYVQPSLQCRTIIFSIAVVVISGVSIFTLWHHYRWKLQAPEKCLIFLLVIRILLTVSRVVNALMHEYATDVTQLGSVEMLVIMILVPYSVGLTLTFFWLVTHKSGTRISFRRMVGDKSADGIQ